VQVVIRYLLRHGLDKAGRAALNASPARRPTSPA
jgi:hypothetical protein